MEADLAQAVPHRMNGQYESLFKPHNFDLTDYYQYKANAILFSTLLSFTLLSFTLLSLDFIVFLEVFRDTFLFVMQQMLTKVQCKYNKIML